MGEFDGVHHLVEAAHHLIAIKGHQDIQFCFVGDGPNRQSLMALAQEKGIADFCDFPGRVPDNEMILRISSCDVCVAPDPLNALNDKSTMNKILEYMALRRPIVQYDLVEGKRSAGEASLYARPNDIKDLATMIECLLQNPGLRLKMGAIGRRRMERDLEWRHQTLNLLKAYERTFSPEQDSTSDL